MKLTDSAEDYGAVTRVLHWCVAVSIAALIVLGWWMVGLSYYDRWYNDALVLHKAIGIIALALGAVKVAWIAFNPRVALGARLARWERFAARSVHRAFYVLMLLVPASGYLISTSAGDGVAVFGLVEVPALLETGETVRDWAIEVHYWAAYGTGVLLLLHAGAALKHQLVDRDGTLRRMLW